MLSHQTRTNPILIPLHYLSFGMRPKNKSSRLARDLAVGFHVNLVKLPSKHCLIMSLNFCFEKHWHVFSPFTMQWRRRRWKRRLQRILGKWERKKKSFIGRLTLKFFLLEQEAQNVDSDLIIRRMGGTWHEHSIWCSIYSIFNWINWNSLWLSC